MEFRWTTDSLCYVFNQICILNVNFLIWMFWTFCIGIISFLFHFISKLDFPQCLGGCKTSLLYNLIYPWMCDFTKNSLVTIIHGLHNYKFELDSIRISASSCDILVEQRAEDLYNVYSFILHIANAYQSTVISNWRDKKKCLSWPYEYLINLGPSYCNINVI